VGRAGKPALFPAYNFKEEKFMKKFFLMVTLVLSAALIFTACDDNPQEFIDSHKPAPPHVPTLQTWGPVPFDTLSLTGSNKYVDGNWGFGNYPNDMVLDTANATVKLTSTGNYQNVTIFTGTAYNGQNYYWASPPGFSPSLDTVYTLSFMASVESGTGKVQIKRYTVNAVMSDSNAVYHEDTLTTTPKLISYTFAYKGGNILFGNQDGGAQTLIVSDLKITWME
jgi:hypothetical protein